MVILGGDVITVEDLPTQTRIVAAAADHGPVDAVAVAQPDGTPLSLKEYRESAERGYITRTLEECTWNISKAAVQLGVERTNLHKKMRAYGIRRG
jgi:transcriptional regulator of acetoin/glycerol metabolism